MGSTNFQPIYRGLLEGGNLDVLLNLGKAAFRETTEICYRAGLIHSFRRDWDGVEDVTDVLGLLRTRLATRDDAVVFASLTIRFRPRLRTHANFRRMHRICTEMRPLFELLRVHRNRQQHQRNEAPTPAQVRSLASTILHLLDLAPTVFRRRPECAKLEHEVRTALGAVGEEAGPLGQEVTRLRLENRALAERNSNLEKLATKTTISVREIQELIASRHEETVTRIRKSLESESGGIRSDLDARADGLEARSQEILERLAEGSAPVPPANVVVRQPPPSGADETGATETSRVSTEAAERNLRALRDQIRRENPDVKPWENICMLRPVVEQALQGAAEGKLGTVEAWKQLPAVRQKFRDPDAMRKRDAQLEKYGDPMMAIYRRVEWADDDPGF